MALYLINQHQALSSCPGLADGGSAIVLMEDAVYALLGDQPPLVNGATVYAITDDALTRGVPQDTIRHPVEWIDYDGLVTLTEQHHPIVSWES